MFYKIKNNDFPHTVANLVNYNPVTYNFRQPSEMTVPFPRTDTIRIHFTYQFNNNWSELSNDLKNCENVKVFKKKLKNSLL